MDLNETVSLGLESAMASLPPGKYFLVRSSAEGAMERKLMWLLMEVKRVSKENLTFAECFPPTSAHSAVPFQQLSEHHNSMAPSKQNIL